MGVKYLKAPYSRKTRVTKQTCTPRDPKKVLWFHTSNFFKKMQQEFGVWETQGVFKRALEEFGWRSSMMFLDVLTVSGKGRTLFIVISLDIIVLIPSINVLSGVSVALCSSSWVCSLFK
jgi:hypothetical protein